MDATDELARLQAAAERAQAGFHHEEAIALSEGLKLLESRSFVGPELQQDDIIIVAIQC
jgi:hypothetical protein